MVAGASIPSFPAPVSPEYMGAPIYKKSLTLPYDYFVKHRNEVNSRITTPRYGWGMLDIPYNAPAMGKTDNRFLKMPTPEFTLLDRGRQQEVDNFYIACQLHRDQYMDHSHTLQPLNFFKKPEYYYQCPEDPTSVYLRYPDRFVEYKKPTVLPLTLDRSYRSPLLPDRVLTGVYNKTSDINYKR